MSIDFSNYIQDRSQNFVGREWVLTAIDNWLGDSNGPPIFIISGQPGSGKTAIAARLIQLSEDSIPSHNSCANLGPGFISAYHFCSISELRWQSPRAFVESISDQLSARYPNFGIKNLNPNTKELISFEVHQEVEALHGNMHGITINQLSIGAMPIEDLFIKLVLEPLEQLLQRTNFDRLVILVDGLDESLTMKEQVRIADLIIRTKAMSKKVKIILTTRPDDQIEKLLAHRTYQTLSLNENQYKANYEDDIRLCVNDYLKRNPELLSKLVSGMEPDAFRKSIRRKGDGNFLYVLNLLKMLDSLAEKIDESRLEHLPTELEELYKLYLSRLVDDDDQWFEDFAPIIGKLVVAQRALSILELDFCVDIIIVSNITN